MCYFSKVRGSGSVVPFDLLDISRVSSLIDFSDDLNILGYTFLLNNIRFSRYGNHFV